MACWKDLFLLGGASVMVNFDHVTHFTPRTDTSTAIYFGENNNSHMIVVEHRFEDLMGFISDYGNGQAHGTVEHMVQS
ncbi:hypothetical protein BTR14_20520 [Rhizobium rhizosphaerae]|uniref:Uncharacterized protein n=1 Tax=Xaviernesmea rhizosphaerae TaxID=1672749 RepID=A0ABX3P7Y4_9HYPH|nr:hypothetical protein [Xaviernesmea rhizosphaerae]OQP84189.1 hypothetical protein BTR14_20520 [Xaviernesmea rhizosphaerae]